MQINLENELGVNEIYIYRWVVLDQLPASKYFSDRGSKLHRLMKVLKLNGIA
jgi:hypothetical protein